MVEHLQATQDQAFGLFSLDTSLPIPPNLRQEIRALQQPGIEELGPWYLLPKTGFNVRLQIDQLVSDLQQGNSAGENPQDTIERSFQKIEQDIQGFKIEYLCAGPLFPIVLETKNVDGQNRLVAPLYNDKPLVDTVSEKERAGKVKESVTKIKDFLNTAPIGSVAILTSAPGPSGIDGVTYTDSQTYGYQVQENGRIRGFTIRTDMTLAQNQKLLEHFGANPNDLAAPTQNEQLVKMAASPIFLWATGNKSWQIEDVATAIKNIKNSPYAYKNRSFAEIYESLKNPQRLWTLDATTQKLVGEFKSMVKEMLASGRVNRTDLEMGLGITVLKLAEAIRGKRPTMPQQPRQIPNFAPMHHPTPYIETLRDVQSLPGCNGGGTPTAVFSGTLSPRFAEISKTSAPGEQTLNCTCPFCNTKVEAIIANGRITCPNPNCGKSAPYNC